MNSLVSVIIPVYNASAYLPQCLESVIHQTYPNLEILVIDDDSTDNSAAICEAYARRDPRIRIITIAHGGLSAARNTGIEHANGAYLAFLDSDDWMELHAITTLVKTSLHTNSSITCAGTCSEYPDRTYHPKIGKETHAGQTIIQTDLSSEPVRVFRGEDVMTAYKNGLFRDVAWNKLYRAEIFVEDRSSEAHPASAQSARDQSSEAHRATNRSLKFRFPEGHNFEDIAIMWKIMKLLAETDGTVTSLTEELFHWRMRKESITHTYSADNIIDCWLAQYGRYKGLAENGDRYLGACFMAIGRMWMNYNSFSKDEKRRAEETVREMQAFSRANRSKVLHGNHPRFVKMVCLLSQVKTPPAMAIGHQWGKLRQARQRREEGELFQ